MFAVVRGLEMKMLDCQLEPQLIVTTNCSLYRVLNSCGASCYFRAEAQKYNPREMSIELYKKLLDIFSQLNFFKLVFIGGEPTTHSHLEELLSLSLVPIRLFTNGLFSDDAKEVLKKYSSKLRPLFFHYHEQLPDNLRQKANANIESLVESDAEIALRVNYSSPLFDFESVKSVCKRVSDVSGRKKKVSLIGFSFSCPEDSGAYRGVPIEDLPKYAQQYLRFVKEIGEERGIPMALGRPIPPCILDNFPVGERESIFRYLEQYSAWTGKCRAVDDLTVNVDGTPQVCSVLHRTRITKVIESVEDLRSTIVSLKSEEVAIRSKAIYPVKKCGDCEYKDKPYDDELHCQGGCLTYRINT